MSALVYSQHELNVRLWSMLQAYVPRAHWVHTEVESPTHVHWMCLGPDERYFKALAYFVEGKWHWEFLEAEL